MSETFTAEQAVAQLIAAENPPEQVEETPAVEGAEVAEEQPETVEAEGEDPEAEGEEQEAEAEAVTPPDKWDAEDKAWFLEQPPEVQSKILEQETKRELVLNKAREKASEEARREVEGEITQVKAVAEVLKEIVPKAIKTFNQQWADPDWIATFDKYGAEETARMKLAYEAERDELRALIQADEQAQAIARQHTVAEETRKLKELAPELASDATKQRELASFLLKNGATNEDLENMSAVAAALAWDAFKYRNAQAAASAPKPKPPAKPVLKPAAGQAQTSAQRTVQQLENRFAQTGKREDAVALFMAKGL